MKKASIQTLISHLNGETVTGLDVIKAELEAELSKGKAKAEANRIMYAEMKDKVFRVLQDASAPLTAQDIADETGLARGKIVYGLTNYWSSEIEKDNSSKVTTYAVRRA